MVFLNKHAEKYIKIGKRIAFYRKLLGLTQEQLAIKIGVSYSYITKIEAPNTIQPFSLEILFDISEALGIDIRMLLEDI